MTTEAKSLPAAYSEILSWLEGSRFTARQKNLIRVEVSRLSKLPQHGWFTLLHHGVLLEYSSNLAGRVEYIVGFKPDSEVLPRLRHIRDATPLVSHYYSLNGEGWSFSPSLLISKLNIPIDAVLKLVPRHRWSRENEVIKFKK